MRGPIGAQLCGPAAQTKGLDMTFADLGDARYIALETFRHSGQGVVTPVWVAGKNGKLYVITEADSWKVKRIRANSRVRLAPSDSRGNPTGDGLEGIATTLPQEDDEEPRRMIERKYGIQYKLFALMYKIKRTESDRVVLEIVEA